MSRFKAITGPFDVFSILGQSNTYYGYGFDATLDGSGGRVFQWGRTSTSEPNYGGLISASICDGSEQLLHKATDPSYIGFGVAFAKNYYVPNALSAGRSVLLVPCGLGGTGFRTGEWLASTGNLYLEAVSRTNAAMASHPSNVYKGTLWMQGENEAGFDGQTPLTEPAYAAYLDPMIAAFRSAVPVSATAPWVVGGLQPGWVALNSARLGVATALTNTPTRISKGAYADPSSPSVVDPGNGLVHYTAVGQRAFAARWWTAYSSVA